MKYPYEPLKHFIHLLHDREGGRYEDLLPQENHTSGGKNGRNCFEGFWGFSFSFFNNSLLCVIFYWEDSKLDCCYVPLLLNETFYWLLSWMLSPQSLKIEPRYLHIKIEYEYDIYIIYYIKTQHYL